MRRLLFALTFVGLLLATTLQSPSRPAEAHPLGNFTVNHLSLLELRADGVGLRYVLDMAEIPAFTEMRGIDKNNDNVVSDAEKQAYVDKAAPDLIKALDLTVAGKRVVLSLAASQLSFPAGQGGLDTLRLVLDLSGALPAGWQAGADATYKDGSYGDRIGWKQVVVRGGSGVDLSASSAATTDDTAELTAYPVDQLKSPAAVTTARFHFAAGASDAAPQPLTAPAPVTSAATTSAPGRSLDHFANLISTEELTPLVVLLSLLAAIAWGAAHALGPGHGKTIVAAYLVGSRGTAKHAALLGLTVTATHTSSVVLLGIVTLYASRFFSTQALYLWLSVASGVAVAAMGAYLLASRLRRALRSRHAVAIPAHTHAIEPAAALEPAFAAEAPVLAGAFAASSRGVFDNHDFAYASVAADASGGGLASRWHDLPASSPAGVPHSHDGVVHDHAHDDFGGHGHSHAVPEGAIGIRALLALGISGGIVPCPTALVVMLAAIALDRIVYGLVLILAFSVGLAGVLVGIGLVVVFASQGLGKPGRLGALLSSPKALRWLQTVPIASAFVILIVGLVLTERAVQAL